jgi:hypothetical protein
MVSLILPQFAAADDDARDYIPAPPGTMLMIGYYKHIWADSIYSGGQKVTDDIDFKQDLGIVRMVYFTQLGPFVIDPQFLLPIAGATLDTTNIGGVKSSSTGVGDLIVTATCWFINDPKSKTWFGFTPFITMPTGEYDKFSPVNIGNNRWAFKPEIGFVKGIGEKLYIDLIANVEAYSDNDDYLGHSKLEQDPVLGVEAHVSYDITKTFYASVDYFYHYGGKTIVDDVSQNNRQSNHGIQLSLAYSFLPGYQVLLQYRNDFEVESGIPTQQIGFRFVYAFDLNSRSYASNLAK